VRVADDARGRHGEVAVVEEGGLVLYGAAGANGLDLAEQVAWIRRSRELDMDQRACLLDHHNSIR